MPVPVPQSPAARPADEATLVARAVQKDEGAVRAIIQRHNRRLYRLARSVVRDDSEAEDVLQDAYVRAFTHLATFRGDASLGTWLSRIVLNEALGRLRRKRPTVELSEIDRARLPQADVIPFPLAHQQPDPERTMAQRQIHAMLEQAIDDLPDAFRTVLVARVIEDMSIEETAALLELRPETVKTRLHRARTLLKQAMEKHLGAALTDAFPFDGRRCERVADAVVARLNLTER
jgi:RNA polymerase sigma-70 factor (ECF subfamily)